MSGVANDLRVQAHRATAEYAPGEDRLLAGYAAAITTFITAAGALSALARAQHRPLPTPSGFDVILITGAAHKLARLISKENVTSAIRAPSPNTAVQLDPVSCPRKYAAKASSTPLANSSHARFASLPGQQAASLSV